MASLKRLNSSRPPEGLEAPKEDLVSARLKLKAAGPLPPKPSFSPTSPRFNDARKNLATLSHIATFKTNEHSDSFHSFDPREMSRYVARINKVMAGTADYSPMTSDDLMKKCGDGKWLCKFMNTVQPGTIDESVINKSLSQGLAKLSQKDNGVNPWANTETINIFINAARGIGVDLGSVGSSDFAKAEEEAKEHLMLGVIWQLLRRQLANEIKEILVQQAAAALPPKKQKLSEILAEGEDASASEALAQEEANTAAAIARAVKDPETFLCEWISSALVSGGVEGLKLGSVVSDMSTTNSNSLAALVHALDPTQSSQLALSAEDPEERAIHVIQWASEHGIPSLTQAEDLKDTNPRLIMPFIMGLFTWSHANKPVAGLEVTASSATADSNTMVSVWVVRQHWSNPGDPTNGVKAASSSSTICAFKKEEDALKYVLTENITLVGTDPELPHLIMMAAEFARVTGYDQQSVIDSLGPIPGVLAKPEDLPEDDALKLRERVDAWVKSISGLAYLKAYQENLTNVLLSNPIQKLYAVDNATIF